MKTKRTPQPTEQQTRILRRIAQSGGILVLTLSSSQPGGYADGDGVLVPADVAKVFIRNGWVVPNRDSMFDLTPQSWRVQSHVK